MWRGKGPPPQAAASGKTVRYQVPEKDLKYLYATAPPVARLHPADILETNTVDALGNAIQKPGDTLALVKGDNPLTGLFFIESPEPRATLSVNVLDLQFPANHPCARLAPASSD